MAGVSLFNQISCKSPLTRLSSKSSLFPTNSIRFGKTAAKLSIGARPAFRVRAVSEEEWRAEGEAAGGVAVAEEPTEIDLLKKQLVDSFYGTDRGLRATSETRAEIVELITQLEAKNPTAAPTEALTMLNGKWILACQSWSHVQYIAIYMLPAVVVSAHGLDFKYGFPFPVVFRNFDVRDCRYTSFVGLFPLLSRTLPLVKVEEVSQIIDSQNFTVQNSVLFSGPLATTSFSTNAKFEVRSPKRVQIKFEEGIVGTPQLTDSIVLPENVEFLGQNIDLTPFKGLITSVQDTASSVAKTISSQPPLKFSIPSNNAESWLLTTYLDEELRISRGDAGSVFVLIKEGSSLLTSL
ncbi:hypothetical protein TEA_014018 [Camellia sinensis var. sinensis]|uniref:Plastid lipid-associated protein/fibrillin conserved domain-containing protein n=1 Tax=Camellia sinensis var. sinensis TaxID=542762 RepID=A0A4S4EFB8_CAMSN|nr:hypothetical protein TEA_014018 [Camellia sinensis var. sinensis]